MNTKVYISGLLLLFILLCPAVPALLRGAPLAALQEEDQALRQEEQLDYYQKWLNSDVVYIITADEASVFDKLTTNEEREQFIEQFWRRRDPDLTTSANEYKEEHYRRIAYANERFKSGVPGWKTDRGRIYIIHGDPTEIESHKMGQSYSRPSHEGGGTTVTYPFEVWRYRHLEGIGDDIELEFVDPGGSGEFRLAITPWEKDALLMIPGTGLTIAEESGMARRQDHPYFRPWNADTYVGMHQRAKDDPFQRYETLAKVQRPQALKYKDLKELVEVDVSYNNLPVETHLDYFFLSSERLLAPLTLAVENKNLTYKDEMGLKVARIAVYGLITSMTNQIISEFDDDLMISFKPEELTGGLLKKSVYQKVLSIEHRMRYRVDLVVKDLNSSNVGIIREGILPPRFEGGKLTTSSLILSDSLEHMKELPSVDEMFVIGDIKVRPKMEQQFSNKIPFWVYLQVYNVAVDQTSFTPALAVHYRVLKDGVEIAHILDEKGESVQYFSPQRIVLVKGISIARLPEGKYQLLVDVEDRIANESASISKVFEVAPQ